MLGKRRKTSSKKPYRRNCGTFSRANWRPKGSSGTQIPVYETPSCEAGSSPIYWEV